MKSIFFALAPKPSLPHDRASILMYHSIDDPANHFFSVSLKNFEQQMAYLAEQHIPVVPLPELVRRVRDNEPLGGAVAITFDDGYENNYTVAFPILQAYRFPATVFAVTDLVGKTGGIELPHATVPQLQDMHSSGLITIAPHSMSHPKLALLSRASAEQEIQGSKVAIEHIIGGKASVFAYPYGDHSSETVELVREAGFDGAVTVEEGTVGPKADMFRLPRNSIDSSTTFSQFRGKVSTLIDLYQRYKNRL